MTYENKDDTGVLFKNKDKEEGDNRPDYTGTLVQNGQERRLAAWLKKSKKGTPYMSIQVSDFRNAADGIKAGLGGSGSPRQSDATPADEFEDDIPFIDMRGEW